MDERQHILSRVPGLESIETGVRTALSHLFDLKDYKPEGDKKNGDGGTGPQNGRVRQTPIFQRGWWG